MYGCQDICYVLTVDLDNSWIVLLSMDPRLIFALRRQSIDWTMCPRHIRFTICRPCPTRLRCDTLKWFIVSIAVNSMLNGQEWPCTILGRVSFKENLPSLYGYASSLNFATLCVTVYAIMYIPLPKNVWVWFCPFFQNMKACLVTCFSCCMHNCTV